MRRYRHKVERHHNGRRKMQAKAIAIVNDIRWKLAMAVSGIAFILFHLAKN